jgi:hypothetical protein
VQDASLICNTGEGYKAEHFPNIEDDRGVEDDSHGVVVDQRRTPYLTRQLLLLWPDYAQHGSHVMLLSRTVSLTVTRRYVHEHIRSHEGLYMFGPLECITPYFLLRLRIGISLVYTEGGGDEFSCRYSSA